MLKYVGADRVLKFDHVVGWRHGGETWDKPFRFLQIASLDEELCLLVLTINIIEDDADVIVGGEAFVVSPPKRAVIPAF